MASAKIGKDRDGKKVSMLSNADLQSYAGRGGKASSIAKKELTKRGVEINTAE